MAIKPILFNTEMVRAILDGRKTCNRSVIKPQPQSGLCYTYGGSHKSCIGKWTYPNKGAHEFFGEEYKLPENIKDEELSKRWNLPYHTDNILYVRETWSEGYEEGAYSDCWDCLNTYGESGSQCCYGTEEQCSQCDEVMMEWEKLWNSTIKKSDLDRYGWDANPWVWVIEFERCEKPGGV